MDRDEEAAGADAPCAKWTARRTARTAAMAAVFVLAGIAALAAAQKADTSRLTPQAIEVRATPVAFDRANPEHHDFGRLRWLGGLELRSPSPFFGGYSGLVLDRRGDRLLAVSDSGSWFSAHLEYSHGQLSGVTGARIGPLPQKDGKPLQKPRWRDAEAIEAITPGAADGRFLVAFEGKHRIDEYVFAKGAFTGPVGGRALPPNLKRMRSNEGLEAVGLLRGGPYAGALVMFSERLLTREGDHTGAIVTEGRSSPLFLARSNDFDVTDIKGLNDGSLLVLERRFIRVALRLDTRLRLIRAREIAPGARLTGEVLLEAGPGMMIDNFEGLGVSETPRGETVITLISDDNFSFFQRTLLVQFLLR